MVDLAYSQSVQSEGPPGRASPRLPEEVPGAAFGGEVGRSVEGTSELAQQHADAAMEQARHTQYAEGDNALQALQEKLLRDPQSGALTKLGKNAFGIDQQYLPSFDAAAGEIVSAAPDAMARQALQKAVNQRRVEFASQLDQHEIGQQKAYTVQTFKDAGDIATQSAVSNYNHPELIANNVAKLDGSLASLSDQLGWSPEEFSEARYEAHTKLHEGVLDAMLSDNRTDMARAYYDSFKGELKPPEQKSFQAAIQAGEVKSAANQILGQYRLDTPSGAKAFTAVDWSQYTPEQRAEITQKVQSGRNDLAVELQQDPGIRRQFTAVTDAIALGKADSGTLAAVDSLWRRGALTDAQRLTYRDETDRALKKQDGESELFGQMRDAFLNGTKLDPESELHKKGADLLMQSAALNAPPGSRPYNSAAVQIASRIGVIPQSAVSYGRSSLFAGDPQAAAGAANLFAELHDTNPYAYARAVDPETRAVADTISTMVGSGANPETAVQTARDNAQRSKAERDALEEQFRRRYPASNAAQKDQNALTDALSTDAHYAGHGFAIGGHEFFRPGVPKADQPSLANPSGPSLMAEFDSLTHEYFLHTGGNLQQSQALAAKDLKGTWGVTEVNGSRQLMKYAPERMVPGLTAAMIRSDLSAQGHPDAHLVETPETGRSGGKVWNLSQQDPLGAWDVVRDGRGRPLRYGLPEVKAAAAASKVSQDATDRAKLTTEQGNERKLEEVALDASTRR